ncbi:MAG: CAP domain-containing protein [Ruegeria sp.]|uniref:CAP domain-containing protein n=1 Tax=Ruegeria sp. TaxID=1879320 RepID=UPI00349E6ECD
MSVASSLERQMLDLINAERASRGLNPVQLELRLNDSSEDHSDWMLRSGNFSHTGSGGSSAGDRMRDAGFVFSGSWTWAENIAWQSLRGAPGLSDDVENLHDSLMNSSGHRANILNPDVTVIGIGIETGRFQGYDAIMVTQNFAKTSAAVQLDTGGGGGGGGPVRKVVPAGTEGTDAADWLVLAAATPGKLVGREGNDILEGSSANNTLEGNDGADRIHGNGGHDRIFAGDGHDRAWGGDGNDIIYAGIGNDFVYGGAGHDAMHGMNGDDVLEGHAGADRIFGNNGNDKIFAGDGHDRSRGGNGNDVIYSGIGNDFAYGGAGNDTMRGMNGDDVLEGHGGADRMYGDNGWDKIFAGDGDDLVWGGNGNDIIAGGTGTNVLHGGAGADTFIFGKGIDTVKDFEGIDRIDLRSSAQITNFADLSANHMTQSGGNVLIDDGAGHTMLLENTLLSDLNAGDFLF